MSLSIKKLNELLESKGLIPIRYYKLNGKCSFIEITSIKDPSTFIISLSSKYNFELNEEADKRSIHKLKFIDIGKDAVSIENDEISENDLINNYTEINLKNKLSNINEIDDVEGSISGHLEEGYNREIFLKDMSKDEIDRVKSIAKQLNRLKLCTQGVFYKLCIIYKNYFCISDKDSEIKCFIIKNFQPIDVKKIIVTCDLEMYYKNSENIMNDILEIEKGIFDIIHKNQNTHNKNLKLIFDNINNVLDYSTSILKSKEQLDNYLERYYFVIGEVTEKERNLSEKLFKLENNSENYKGLHSDTDFVHNKSKLEDELSKLFEIKTDLIKTAIEIKDNRNNLCMLLDSICFDNTVLCDKISKNLKNIKRTYEILNAESSSASSEK
jgi:hypothetical protein